MVTYISKKSSIKMTKISILILPLLFSFTYKDNGYFVLKPTSISSISALNALSTST